MLEQYFVSLVCFVTHFHLLPVIARSSYFLGLNVIRILCGHAFGIFPPYFLNKLLPIGGREVAEGIEM
jgi:hypothetical protein